MKEAAALTDIDFLEVGGKPRRVDLADIVPASAIASENASTISSSAPQSQRSPNREQPMPRIATLSLIPAAISVSG
ncbi:MAG: hypothetical protein R3E84_14965 [Pseudomonadales bacterium]